MEDEKRANDYDTGATTAVSMDCLDRKMILLHIAENEKSQFEDPLPDADNDNGFSPLWKETESSVTATSTTVPAEWLDVVTMAPEPTDFEKPSAPSSYYELADLNIEPANSNSVRFARVPSQYQLDALSEMFIYDVPLLVQKTVAPPTCAPAAASSDGALFAVNSEYVSELLM